MTANPPSPNPSSRPLSRVQAQIAELRELEKHYPVPTLDEVLEDWKWLYAQSGTASMEPYLEQFVAVCERKVVGADPVDELALRIRLTKEHLRHPERFVITYHG